MISAPLFRQNFKSTYKIIIMFLAIFTMYFTIIISMYDPEKGSALNEFAKSMPQIMDMFGMGVVNSSLVSLISNYLYGFLMLIIPMALTIILTNKLITSYIDKGSMAYLLASKNRRSKVIFTQLAFISISLLIVIAYCTILGIVCGEAMFPGELEIDKFILLNLGVFCLHVALMGFCFFVCCITDESKKAIGINAGILVVFYLIHMIANTGDKLEKFKYATIFSMFNPRDIIAGETYIYVMMAVLFIFGLILLIIGGYIFTRRDLPL